MRFKLNIEPIEVYISDIADIYNDGTTITITGICTIDNEDKDAMYDFISKKTHNTPYRIEYGSTVNMDLVMINERIYITDIDDKDLLIDFVIDKIK